MHRTFLIIASVFGALAVAIGAFGAHGLQKVAGPELVDIYETGVRYQFYHTFALLAVGILFTWYPGKLMTLSGFFFIIGILLFSGSLYLITFLKVAEKTIPTLIGLITPFGGLFLIVGWLLLLLGLLTKR